MKELLTIQKELKASKDQKNTFGGYTYRSAEGILEKLKPLLSKYKCTLTISDDIVGVLDRVYVKATATLRNEAGEVETSTSYAREASTKKGMDEAQITGAASSYARKYALCGLLCIDDRKDPDALNVSPAYTQPAPAPTAPTVDRAAIDDALESVRQARTSDEVASIWRELTQLHGISEFKNLVTARGRELKNKEVAA